MSKTVKLTVGQAVVKFLSQQYSVVDGVESRLVAGMLGIFGHGNVAGIGQALLESELEDPARLPYYLARNEQGAVHAATAFAKHLDRHSTMAVTASIGPGSTNMLTGAALATINRIPVLLFPADTFATRLPDPVLQQLEKIENYSKTVNDSFEPLSVFFDRISRPEQLTKSLLMAMRALTDPSNSGAVTLSIPQDVQAESYDFPVEFFEKRLWQIARNRPDSDVLAQAVAAIATSKRPIIVAGGGVLYSGAEQALADFALATGIPVVHTHAGKGSLLAGNVLELGSVGSTGASSANKLAATADLVLGIGTRYSDFTTASNSIFANPDVQFINVNTTGIDTIKLSGLPLIGDARATILELGDKLVDYKVPAMYSDEVEAARIIWLEERSSAVGQRWQTQNPAGLPSQIEVLGRINDLLPADGVVINAAGSAPGDLHKLWLSQSRRQYHVEYGFSTMGYEIAAAFGVKLADAAAEVVAIVGDASYLMLSQEIVTAVAENRKIIVVLINNHGFGSIGNLSESVGSQRFGTQYRFRDEDSDRLNGDVLPVDYVKNMESLGAKVFTADGIDGFAASFEKALAADVTCAVYVETDPLAPSMVGGAWWQVPPAEVSSLDSTKAARAAYEKDVQAQRHYL